MASYGSGSQTALSAGREWRASVSPVVIAAAAKGNCDSYGDWREQGQVLRLVPREGTALIGVGTVLGFLGAVGIARVVSALADAFVESLQIGARDPLLLIGAQALRQE